MLTGFAIWKPVTLSWLTNLFGGYVWARWWHFALMLVVIALAAAHIFMVVAVDPYAIRSMTTGGYDEALSPEADLARLAGADPAAGSVDFRSFDVEQTERPLLIVYSTVDIITLDVRP